MAIDITHAGTFINAKTAKANLSKYFKDAGKPQLKHDHPDHVFGHVIGLAKVKELLSKIDQHNLNEADTKKHISGLRIYHSKDKTKRDIMVVPVTKEGHDYPDQIHGSSASISKTTHPKAVAAMGKRMILSDTRPCPNQCG